ncbi:MAG: signal peptidase I [Methanomicrobiales archaeon HGW-Methanomicrobiales-6]|jgi:signal peptidase|nr:MAG: signal peptidase I [Methanomicrobiales archaeon HGW-Methanomicrobiales-6]
MIRVDRGRKVIAILLGAAVLVGLLLFVGHGMTLMVVLSGSMTPLMLPGDAIVVAPADPDHVEVGDVVVFQYPGQDERMVITHRIIGIDAETGLFSTKGDANNAPDRFSITTDDIIGRPVFLIPFVGFASEMKKQVILLMVVLPSLLLALLETIKLTRGFHAARRLSRESPVPKGQFVSIRYTRFLPLLVVALIPFLLLAVPSLLGIQTYGSLPGSPDLQGHCITVEGRGPVPELYQVCTPGAGGVPVYGVLQPGETVSVSIPGTGPACTIARSPYVLPVFWFVGLAELNPYLPVLGLAILPGIFLTLALYPLWAEKKFVKLRRKRRLVDRVLEN